MTLAACWRCGKVPTVDPNGGYPIVSCGRCYDGAEDSTRRHEMGSGMNREEAVEEWNEKMAELTDDPPENDTPLAYGVRLR